MNAENRSGEQPKTRGISLGGILRVLASWCMLSAAGVGAQPYTYGGGDVVADAQVVAVYWGTQRPGMVSALNTFYTQLGNSHYFEPLAEYSTASKRLGRANFLTSAAILPGDARRIDTVETAREIDRQILAGVLPYPNEHTIYMVHFGPAIAAVMGSNIFGAAIGAPAGPASGGSMGFCAYHFSARTEIPSFPGVSVFGPKIRIAVIPDAVTSGCATASGVMAATTFSASHELVETITNPDSVLIEMMPVVGANVQCNGLRIPVPGGAPPALNGIATWAWSSSRSGFCNPDEVADTCSAQVPYNTTGFAAGVHAVSAFHLNSLGRCAIAPDVVAPPPKPVSSPARQMCLNQCNAAKADCLDNSASPRMNAVCNRTALQCAAQCPP